MKHMKHSANARLYTAARQCTHTLCKLRHNATARLLGYSYYTANKVATPYFILHLLESPRCSTATDLHCQSSRSVSLPRQPLDPQRHPPPLDERSTAFVRLTIQSLRQFGLSRKEAGVWHEQPWSTTFRRGVLDGEGRSCAGSANQRRLHRLNERAMDPMNVSVSNIVKVRRPNHRLQPKSIMEVLRIIELFRSPCKFRPCFSVKRLKMPTAISVQDHPTTVRSDPAFCSRKLVMHRVSLASAQTSRDD